MMPPVGKSGATPAIAIRDLGKTYTTQRGDILALDRLNAEIADGSFVVVVGPSGCGKSTLLKILAGLQSASSGAALVRGTPVSGPRPDVGVVFQAPVLFPWRTVQGNIMLPIDVNRLPRTRFAATADHLLELVGLSDFADRYPWELSGGMQQRVSIARALINDPSLLLMDEPFGALDAMTREHMNVELQRIWLERRKSVLLITHSIPEAVFLADRVLVMSARPGRFIDDIAIDLPRPRPLEVMSTPAFGDYVGRIRSLFNIKGGIDG